MGGQKLIQKLDQNPPTVGIKHQLEPFDLPRKILVEFWMNRFSIVQWRTKSLYGVAQGHRSLKQSAFGARIDAVMTIQKLIDDSVLAHHSRQLSGSAHPKG